MVWRGLPVGTRMGGFWASDGRSELLSRAAPGFYDEVGGTRTAEPDQSTACHFRVLLYFINAVDAPVPQVVRFSATSGICANHVAPSEGALPVQVSVDTNTPPHMLIPLRRQS